MSARSGERLISPVALVVMGVAIVFILILLFPQRMSFLGTGYLDHPDSLSIAYLRALVRSDAGNTELRIALARQLLAVGNWQEAGDVLRGMLEEEQLSADLLLLKIDLAMQELAALPKGNPRRKKLHKKLSIWVNHLLPLELNVKAQNRLASLMLRYNRPDIAAKIYRELAWQEKDKAEHYWALSARWMLASRQPARAGEYYFNAYEQAVSDEAKHEYASKAVEAMLSVAEHPGLLGYLEKVIKRYPEDRSFLDQGVRIARQQGELARAADWNLLLLNLAPDDIDILVRQRDIELQRGDLEQALHYARQVVSRLPDNAVSRTRLARIAEWAGQPWLAQQQWQWLVRHYPDLQHDRQLLRLARINRDDDGIIMALESMAEKQPLSSEQWEMLVWAWVHKGEPEQAEIRLANYLQHHPDDRTAWRRLTMLQRDMGQYLAEIQSWQQIERNFGERPASVMEQVELYWRLYEEQKAFETLLRVRDFDAVDNDYHLSLAAELAWREGEDELAYQVYRRLWQKDPSRRLLVARRVISLAMQRGDEEQVMRVIADLEEKDRTDVVLYALWDASRRQNMALLGRIIAQTRDQAELYRRVAYWQFRARWHQHENNNLEVARDLEQALKISPESETLRMELLWTLLAIPDRPRLQHYVRLWQEDINEYPELWSPYAIALKITGYQREALYWYARRARANPRDYLWLLDYADMLAQAGRHNSAYRLRLYALAYLRPVAMQAVKEENLDTRLLNRYANLLVDMRGNAQARPWLVQMQKLAVHKADQRAMEFLIGWYLSREAYAPARAWMLRRHLQRMRTPAWQAMSLALADNHLPRIKRLLLAHDTLPVTTRVAALRQTGAGQKALQLALRNIDTTRGEAEGQALRQQAVSLLQDAYGDWGVDMDVHEISDLLIRSRSAHYRYGRQDWYAGVQAGTHQLSRTRTYNLGNIDEEATFRLDGGWFGRRNAFKGYLGQNSRNDSRVSRFGASWQYLASTKLRVTLGMELNALDEISAPFRVAGVVDNASLKINAAIGSREYLNLNIQYNEYQTRSQQELASGRQLDFELGHRLASGTNEWAVNLQGSFERNDLVGILPAELVPNMPAGAVVADLVPAEVGIIGVGVSLNRGQPRQGYPIVASPRYRLSAWLGTDLVNNQPSGRVEAGLGFRLFGSDELSFMAYYSRATSPLRPEPDYGLRLGYRYFLGR